MDAIRNTHLERCMRVCGYTPKTLADHFGLVEKTVRRWISGQCLPYPTHQYAVAALLNVDRLELWPDLAPDTDLVTLYNDRQAVPRDLWDTLLTTEGDVHILANNLSWLLDAHPLLTRTLLDRALGGRPLQLALLDPDHNDTISTTAPHQQAALSRHTLRILHSGLDDDHAPHTQIRLHGGTALEIYRFGDHALIHPRLDGLPDTRSPVCYVQRQTHDGAFDRYLSHVEHVWETCRRPSSPPDNGTVDPNKPTSAVRTTINGGGAGSSLASAPAHLQQATA